MQASLLKPSSTQPLLVSAALFWALRAGHYAWGPANEVATAVRPIATSMCSRVVLQMAALSALSLALGRGWPPAASAAVALALLASYTLYDCLTSPQGIGLPLLPIVPLFAVTWALFATARMPRTAWRSRAALAAAAIVLALSASALTFGSEDILPVAWRELPDVPMAALAPAVCLRRALGAHMGALAAAVAVLALGSPPAASQAAAFAIAAARAAADIAATRIGGETAAATAAAVCGRSTPPALAVVLAVLAAAAAAAAVRGGTPLAAARRCPCRTRERLRQLPPS